MLLRSGYDTFASNILTFLLKNIRNARNSSIVVTSIDRLPQKVKFNKPLYLVVNESKHDENGSHWVAIYLDRE